MKKRYCIIDLETTGGVAKRDKITEIAIIVYDGEKIVDEFQSLVNPERSIPAHITRITGITNEMVEEAPRFFEIAKRVIELTEGTIFVAHNVRFDYSFLIEEFRSLGYTFTRRNLCTVKLSRKAFPGLQSYALGNLIKYFGIEVQNRHRAYDDAYATTILLDKIFKAQDSKKSIKAMVSESIKLTKLPSNLNLGDIESLPSECGVYYFMDNNNDIAYIGKSKNIYKRVKQHFGKNTRKTDKLFKSIHAIEYELTGSELISLIKESFEIKKHQPQINKIQKTKDYNFAIVKSTDNSGYARYEVKHRRHAEEALSFYGSKKSALNHIEQIGELFGLCHKVNGLDKQHEACFNFGIEKCKGACIGQEPAFEYNQRFEESLLSVNRLFNENFIVIEEGRNRNEKAVVLVEDGHFRSYGYIDAEESYTDAHEIKALLNENLFNPEADLIIRNYLWSKTNLNVIYF